MDCSLCSVSRSRVRLAASVSVARLILATSMAWFNQSSSTAREVESEGALSTSALRLPCSARQPWALVLVASASTRSFSAASDDGLGALNSPSLFCNSTSLACIAAFLSAAPSVSCCSVSRLSFIACRSASTRATWLLIASSVGALPTRPCNDSPAGVTASCCLNLAILSGASSLACRIFFSRCRCCAALSRLFNAAARVASKSSRAVSERLVSPFTASTVALIMSGVTSPVVTAGWEITHALYKASHSTSPASAAILSCLCIAVLLWAARTADSSPFINCDLAKQNYFAIVIGIPIPFKSPTVVWFNSARRRKLPRSHSVSEML